MTPLKVKTLKEAKRYFRKTQPVKLRPYEKRLADLEKNYIQLERILHYAVKDIIELKQNAKGRIPTDKKP